MRRIDFLINKIRLNTNNLSTNRFNDIDIGIFLSDSQRSIQTVAINNNVRSDFFSAEYRFFAENGKDIYDLPEDIFSKSSINSVEARTGHQSNDYASWTNLANLTNVERAKGFGYILRDNKIILSPVPMNTNTEIRIIYVKSLPDVGPRYAQIESKTLVGSVLTIVANIVLNDKTLKLSDYFDHFSVVSKDGVFEQKKLSVNSFQIDTPTPGKVTIITDSPTGTVTVGSYVVGGLRTSSQSELPDVCEKLLCSITERFIQYIDSSKDANASTALSNEEGTVIIELFKNHTPDSPYPPISNGDYLNL